MDATALQELFNAAAAAYRTDPDDERMWQVLAPALRENPDAIALSALPLLGTPDPALRMAALTAVRYACEVGDTLRERVADTLIARAGVEHDADVCQLLALALGATASVRVLPALIALAAHDDFIVRTNVACALPSAMSESRDSAAVNTLLRLMTDAEGAVRDWATFALGRQLDVDGREIREALAARLDDLDEDVRDEAMAGLARRRDRRALPTVTLALSGQPNLLAFEAARYLADPTLVPVLCLCDDEKTEWALERCDPDRRAAWDLQVRDFLIELQQRLDTAFPRAIAAVGCDLCDDDTWLRIDALTDGQWCMENLLADRTVHEAVEQVVARLRTETHDAIPRS